MRGPGLFASLTGLPAYARDPGSQFGRVMHMSFDQCQETRLQTFFQRRQRNPLHFGALSGYGQIHFQLGDYEKALLYWRRALEVNPNMPGVEANIGGIEELLKEKKGRTI